MNSPFVRKQAEAVMRLPGSRRSAGTTRRIERDFPPRALARAGAESPARGRAISSRRRPPSGPALGEFRPRSAALERIFFCRLNAHDSPDPPSSSLSRRDMLRRCGAGFGWLGEARLGAARATEADRIRSRRGRRIFRRAAKRVIQILRERRPIADGHLRSRSRS